jgi:cellulose synthase/poly-beta-1,6-N-acetylglucosamine synthase-like glycosyltransferase
MHFNGTAGVWRRETIADAGGWQHDTLTEDLDLSYRAQLLGWKFVFLPDLVAPAEVPVEMMSFKSQQHRWAKGSIQTCLKLLPRILRSKQPPRLRPPCSRTKCASSRIDWIFVSSE